MLFLTYIMICVGLLAIVHVSVKAKCEACGSIPSSHS